MRPPALAPGHRVAVLAPASPFDRAAFDRGLDELRALGVEPVFDDRVFARRRYVAGPAAERAEAFAEAWTDPSIAGIFCARGGYGSVQLLPHLDLGRLRGAAKVFVGYSDLTSLLSMLTLRLGVVAFHGPTLVGPLAGGTATYDRDVLRRAVSRAEPLGTLSSPDLESLVPGEAAGPLLGGTLTQLVGSLGTPYAFDPPPGHVLFVDEVGERPYRLDRLLTQLALSGVLRRAAGLVFGELPRCDEPGGAPSARDVIRELTDGFPGPVLVGFPSGHTLRPALTLPLGVRARVIGRPSPALVVEEAAVR
jgi:muramoyltetrapeptide carboxypeptidase